LFRHLIGNNGDEEKNLKRPATSEEVSQLPSSLKL
jgi:hypothetical protein